jgi:hypothetical protein
MGIYQLKSVSFFPFVAHLLGQIAINFYKFEGLKKRLLMRHTFEKDFSYWY